MSADRSCPSCCARAVRALTRKLGSARLPEGVDVVRGDLSVRDTLDSCLNGVDDVFLVWPGLMADFAPAVLEAADARGFRGHELTEIRKIVMESKEFFLEKWNEYFGGEV